MVMVRVHFCATRILPMPDPVSVPAQLTPALLSSTLLELTGDLDKADVLQQRIPRWLFEAKP
jgi:hypothetical protein